MLHPFVISRVFYVKSEILLLPNCQMIANNLMLLTGFFDKSPLLKHVYFDARTCVRWKIIDSGDSYIKLYKFCLETDK